MRPLSHVSLINFGTISHKSPRFMSHDMTMRVSTDRYLHHTSRSQLMQVFRLPPVKDGNFSFYFSFLTHSCLFHSPHLTWTTGPLSTKQCLFLASIWHINAPGLALTSHVVKFVHCNTHTHSPDLCPRAPSVCVPCCTISQASIVIYPMHVLVCLRAFYSIHTT